MAGQVALPRPPDDRRTRVTMVPPGPPPLPYPQPPSVTIDRPVFNRIRFDDMFEKREEEKVPLWTTFRKRCVCSPSCFGERILGLFPFIATLRTYKVKQYLIRDLLAGVSVGMIHIPQGMGFAILTSVAPVYGLYSSFWPVLIYFFFGSSHHISVGTMAIISIVLGSVVEREAAYFREVNGMVPGDPGDLGNVTTALPLFENLTSDSHVDHREVSLELYKASVASAVSLVSGIIMFGMGILRLGILTTVMPTSFVGGFTTGAAIHITMSQLSGIFGVKLKRFDGILKLPYSAIELVKHLPDTNVATLLISVCCLVILIFFKEFINERFKRRLPIPVPIEMFLLAIGTLCSYFGDFSNRWEVKTIGTIPSGIPAPFIPPLARTNTFIFEAITIGILCFTISIAMADIFASKHKYQVDPNQELIAYGLSYGLSSFMYCFIGAAAPPRCFVQDSTGGKTQVTSIFTALILLLVLLVIGPLFQTLPNTTLSCIVIVAIFPLFKQFRNLPNLWRLCKSDFFIWVITLVASIFLDITLSLAVGISVSILTIIVSSMMAPGYLIGQTKYQDIYASTSAYKNVRQLDGIAIFRYECTLYFATIQNFKSEIFKAIGNPQERGKPNLREARVDEEPLPAVNRSNVPVMNIRNVNGVIHTNIHIDDFAEHKKSNSLDIHTIILDCSPFGYVDVMGINTIRQLHSDYRLIDIDLVLAGCCQGLLRQLELVNLIGGKKGDVVSVYHTVQDAVVASDKIRPTAERTVTYL